ncbi:MAG: Omp28-related outer membrane protein [Chitinophagales bacterium]|nr:Omp28-related outer membrane protein [Chitinophagales bacterium]
MFKKQALLLFFLIVAGCLFHSCDEIGPNINYGGGGGNVDTTNERVVLMEVFTAVRCVNCPAGREIINDLLDSFPGRIEVVEIHSGDLAVPIHNTDPDFRCEDADNITAYLGPFPFQPSAAIDRKSWELTPGNVQRLIDRNYWNLMVRQELDSLPSVKISIEKDYNAGSRLLTVTMKVDFLKDVSDIINATLLLTESGMVAAQDSGPTDVVEDYVHEDVLRTFLTSHSGELVNAEKTAGSSWSITRSITLPVEWNAGNCRVIGFVSKSAGTYDVLQSAGTSIN